MHVSLREIFILNEDRFFIFDFFSLFLLKISCPDGTISVCYSDEMLTAREESDETQSGRILTLLAISIGVMSLLISLFGGGIYFLRKRRNLESFSHARLNDNVEITNPMYLGDLDDAPGFNAMEQDKVRTVIILWLTFND